MDEIRKLEEDYIEKRAKIREDCYRLAWYMRGALTISEAMMCSWEDREIISKIIKENLETTKKSGLPFF